MLVVLFERAPPRLEGFILFYKKVVTMSGSSKNHLGFVNKTHSFEMGHFPHTRHNNNPKITVSGPEEYATIDKTKKRRKTADSEYVHDTENDGLYRNETKKLRKLLKLYFYATFKLKNNTCSFHSINIFLFLIQVIKVALVTSQMVNFGYDRGNFSEVVSRGHITLRHLLLENWDASWETLAYPPAQGEFAVYTIDDLKSGINYSVKMLYNAEKEATGYFIRTEKDSIDMHVKYFDFPGFEDTNITDGVLIHEKTFPVKVGLSEKDGEYDYNVTKEFEYNDLTQPIKRMLSTTLQFSLHSVRVHAVARSARCLRIKGWVSFNDLDNNGQVNVNLETVTSKIKCEELNITLTDWALENTSEELGAALIVFCLLSILASTANITLGIYAFWRTKRYMKVYFRRYFKPIDDDEKDLSAAQYRRFLKMWNIVVIFSDILTLYGTVWIVFENERSVWLLETLDSYAVWLGFGCFLTWISLLRFFKFHNKFHLLFKTLNFAFLNVAAYLLCVVVLFTGFWISGFVVLGPYHVKFRTPGTSAETLLALVNGDEIFTTLAILETDKTGGEWVWWFCRFYIGAYVSVFTIVIVNLLIAIYMSAYESIRAYYEESPDERDLGPMEKALRKYLADQGSDKALRSSIYGLLSDEKTLSAAENTLRREMKKLVRLSGSKNDIVLIKSTTLKTFIMDGEDKITTKTCGFFSVSIVWFFGKD